MKNSAILMLLLAGLFLTSPDASSQVKIDLKKKLNRETNRRANKKTDEAINKGFNKMEEGVKGLLKKKGTETDSVISKNVDGNPTGTTQQGNASQAAQTTGEDASADPSPALSWAKYDFVPGDKIIFEDNHFGEENGEFPSRWDLVRGTTENAEFGDEKIIMFRGGAPQIIPYLKNSSIDYLPDVFTIEFDLWTNCHNQFELYFWDTKNQRVSSEYRPLQINYQGMNLSPASSRIPENGTIVNKWAHISVAYTNGKMKAYIDETRLINIPHLAFNPMGITLYAYSASDNNKFYVKNFRLAEGGVKYYDRFLQDGKIVSNGIRFDVGKATLRPESMGVLNEIYKMLSEHPDIAVSVEGHTDSDGDFDKNQQLSQDRAASVRSRLIDMGIEAHRFSIQGFGESKPVDTNDTPEGKASNRRVEFVKK